MATVRLVKTLGDNPSLLLLASGDFWKSLAYDSTMIVFVFVPGSPSFVTVSTILVKITVTESGAHSCPQ